MVGKLTPNDRLSASLTPVFLNASPYMTQNALLHEMIQRDLGIEPEPFGYMEAAWWGNEFEHKIGTEAAKRLGLTDLKLEFDEAFHHADLPFAASLDGMGTGHDTFVTDTSKGIYVMNAESIDISGPGLLEIKNTSAMPETTPARHRGPLQGQGNLCAFQRPSGWRCASCTKESSFASSSIGATRLFRCRFATPF